MASSSSVLESFMREVRFVKAQVADDSSDIRLLRLYPSNINLRGLLTAGKDAFPETLVSIESSCLIQFRDTAGDFITLRQDFEIEALKLSTFLDKTVIKFVPQGYKRTAANNIATNTSDQGNFLGSQISVLKPVETASEAATLRNSLDEKLVEPDVQKIVTENTLIQLSKNFEEFRRSAKDEFVSLSKKLDDLQKSILALSAQVPHAIAASALVPEGHCNTGASSAPPTSDHHGTNSGTSASSSISVLPMPAMDTLKPGTLWKKFSSYLRGNGHNKVTLTGQNRSDKIHVPMEAFLKARDAGDAQHYSEESVIVFSQVLLDESAESVCGCSFGAVLDDLNSTKASNTDIVTFFIAERGGNTFYKVVFHWGTIKWQTSGFTNKDFKASMNAWLRNELRMQYEEE